MLTDFTSKNINNFICEKCHFKCSKKGDYNRHILTAKHILLTEKHLNTPNHNCLYCDKKYTNKSHLTVHLRIHSGIFLFSKKQYSDGGIVGNFFPPSL